MKAIRTENRSMLLELEIALSSTNKDIIRFQKGLNKSNLLKIFLEKEIENLKRVENDTSRMG